MVAEQTHEPVVVAVIGATGTGKSELAIDLAQRFHGSVVSADSMQVYRGMDIGTAKLSISERQGVPHALIDVVDPDQSFSVAEYQKMALDAIREILRQGNLPIVVGGTGLYLRALLDGYDFLPEEPDHGLRKDLLALPEETLRKRLRALDLAAEHSIAAHDVKRLERALEIALQSGDLPSRVKQQRHAMPWLVCRIGLHMDRPSLYARLDARVDRMIAGGMEQEVRLLLANGLTSQQTAMQGIGYKELAAWIEGKTTKEAAVQVWKRRTRNYAKRQETWFRREENVYWIDVTRQSPNEVLENAARHVAELVQGENV